jgi:hypothetical protein
VKDAAGRAPGIYTYLAGEPNKWSKAKVDHNLRTENDPFAVMGPFDPASIMLYRFAAFFYKSNPSACAPTGPGQELSEGDKRGLALLYPATADDATSDQAQRGLEIVSTESVGGPQSVYMDRLVELLETHATAAG